MAAPARTPWSAKGNDVYVVDDIGDVTTEALNAGTDEIKTSISIATALAANIENLTLLGTGDLQGLGNTLANVITGNTGNNSLFGAAGDDSLFGNDNNDTLEGGAGKDSMTGGLGDDTYIV
jgi:Ca2+-binding RTX toxin-like protein